MSTKLCTNLWSCIHVHVGIRQEKDNVECTESKLDNFYFQLLVNQFHVNQM